MCIINVEEEFLAVLASENDKTGILLLSVDIFDFLIKRIIPNPYKYNISLILLLLNFYYLQVGYEWC